MDIESRNATARHTQPHTTKNGRPPPKFEMVTWYRNGHCISNILFGSFFVENHQCESDDMKFNLVVLFISVGFCADGVTTDVCGRTACDDMFTRPTIPYYVGFFSFFFDLLLLRRLLLLFFTSLDFFKRNNLTSGQQQQHPIIKLNEGKVHTQHRWYCSMNGTFFLCVYIFFFHSTSNFKYS